ncbi:hypothetical protein ACJMK2_030315 [Sinanodonta woodiana]|uniref:Uncharacterized protein n=1 Tax=Sinanodonta woodiana TaxID=1069815 RepID=A0ABD3XGI2_SINWO
MSYELETNTGVRCPVLELSESGEIVKEYTLDERSPRREEELPATESSRMAGSRKSLDEEENRLSRSGAAAMLQTKGDKSKYYGNTATVNEDTGQYSIDLNECVAAAVNTAVTRVMQEMSGAMKNIEIVLQGMTTGTETSSEVIPAVVPRDKLTETRRHDRSSTIARARMSRVNGSESEEEKYSSGISGSNLSRIKLPAFTGKENWKVGINRFTAVAERSGWRV